MAIDPEELRKRRHLRKQAQRKSRRRRILFLSLGAVAVAVIVTLILILTASPNPSQKEPAPSDFAEDSANNTVLQLAFAGDLNITEKVVAAGGASYDYTDTFMDVLPLLAEADITALNLEGNFYGAPYGADHSAPEQLAGALASAGVDVVQLANSYSIYKGMDGLSQTINTLRAAKLIPLGAYASAADARAEKGYTMRTVQGVKIAFVAFTKGMDGMALPEGNAGCVNLLYKDYNTDYQVIDTEGITKILNDVNAEMPDLVVAMLHWGSEYNDNISDSQEKIRTLLQENGVDAILGTHSHYVQKMELDPENGTFIAYSLGDFFSDAQKSGSEYSVVLNLEVTKNNTTGQTKITSFSYTPIFTAAEKDQPLKLLQIHPAMKAYEDGYLGKVSPETYEAMKYALTRIEARIHGS